MILLLLILTVPNMQHILSVCFLLLFLKPENDLFYFQPHSWHGSRDGDVSPLVWTNIRWIAINLYRHLCSLEDEAYWPSSFSATVRFTFVVLRELNFSRTVGMDHHETISCRLIFTNISDPLTFHLHNQSWIAGISLENVSENLRTSVSVAVKLRCQSESFCQQQQMKYSEQMGCGSLNDA